MMPELRIGNSDQELDEIRVLVRKGYLFAVQEWIAEEKAIFVPADRFQDHQCPLLISVQSGFHSMVQILADVWPDEKSLVDALHIAAIKRRLDIVWMLLSHVTNLKLICLYTIAGCNDKELMRYFLDRWDEVDNEEGIQSILMAMPRPLTGLIREYAPRFPNSQFQLAHAMRTFVSDDHPRWIGLTLWMGGNPRLRVPDSRYKEDDPDEWLSPLEYAALTGNVQALKLMKPSPERDDIDELLKHVCFFRESGREAMEYLIKCGARINSKENGGSLIFDRFFSDGFRYLSGQYKSCPDYYDIKFLQSWIERGAKWVPSERYQLTEARSSIRGMSANGLWDFLKTLSAAAEEYLLLDLCNSKIMRDALKLTNSEIKQRINAIYHPPQKKGRR